MGRLQIALILAGAVMAQPAQVREALAQKAADTLRVAYVDPISTALVYDDTKPETTMTSSAIFDTMVCYDRADGSFVPQLASSWRTVDDRTLEFKLRDDIAFHDGSMLTAEDVAYTLNWVVDPASKIRFAEIFFGWLEHAEALDATTVHVVAKQPTPAALMISRLAVSAEIVPAKLHRAYENKSDFGRKGPVGTGPYKAVSVDSTNGIVLARSTTFNHASPCKPAPAIANIRILPMPDLQTQIAQLTVGGIDLMKGQSKDDTEMLAQVPGIAATAIPDMGLLYLAIDSIGRSGNTALAKLKVRQAIARAVDREFVARSVMPGGEAVRSVDALCIKGQIACASSVAPPSYAPGEAKTLLAEAGYPDGFEALITVIPGIYPIADALAGELRKIGIRASVSRETFASSRARVEGGKGQLILSWFPVQTHVDVSGMISFLFETPGRDYYQDAEITRLAKEGISTLDPEKRTALYRQLFDRVNGQSYVLPIATMPDVWLHAKDLFVDSAPLHPQGVMFYDERWN
jgi:peptide/nickel transport system substrate-binding protein